jgi:hypothetical protein
MMDYGNMAYILLGQDCARVKDDEQLAEFAGEIYHSCIHTQTYT